ncbi:ceramide-1-phosphate transfer protein isoform X1 [Ictalurus furcatus]|uniref:ceramide-1-phosphate transfer protein isoform X1 n=1 Tax=Ictalurus furcatus TaxID=66913 RepID=UPI00234FCCE3|nr:ceramide-1-phosphate transfer protein isoform X1 [Ictalurus furcatus]
MRSLLHQYFLVAAMLTLLLFLTSLWLPQGTVQDCESSWLPCLSDPNRMVHPVGVAESDVGTHTDNITIRSDSINPKPVIISECPGQHFQVSQLLLYLNSALSPTSDVLLDPYLLCWEELIKFMEALGPLVSFFTYKVQEKITLIRQLAEEDSGKHRLLTLLPTNSPLLTHNPLSHTYHSVRSMLDTELQLGVVSFDRQTPSGSRTLLRLHRSLLWLQLLLMKLWLEPGHVRRSLGEVCEEAYSEALAPHHPWLLQRVARLAFKAMPEHTVLLRMVCVNTHEEAEPIIRTIVTAISEVRRRTHNELEKRNMLDLP